MQKYLILFSLIYGVFSDENTPTKKEDGYEYGSVYEYGDEYYPYIFTKQPTYSPTPDNTIKFTKYPTFYPTKKPSRAPSLRPTRRPTAKPTLKPSKSPVTRKPTKLPVPKIEWRKVPTRCRKYFNNAKKHKI